jgi:hypothetical protein
MIDSAATLNALSDRMGGSADQLTLGYVCGQDRGLRTQLAQVIRESVLDDGSLPLGISFPWKTAYGRCCAWWNRRGEANLNPGSNDPKLIDSRNVGTPELHEICADRDLRSSGKGNACAASTSGLEMGNGTASNVLCCAIDVRAYQSRSPRS